MPGLRLDPSATITPTALGLVVRSDLATFQLGGADAGVFLEQVAPLLDGTRDREALAAAVEGFSPRSVAALLDALAARGLIEAAPATGQERFFRAWPGDPARAVRRLAEARALALGSAPWIAAAAAALEAAGVGEVRRVSDDGALEALVGGAAAPWSLLVAAAPPGDGERLARIAGVAHRAGLVSLWSRLTATKAVVGPVVTPGQTACPLCATVEALSPALPAEAAPVPDARREAREQLLGHHVAMEALKVLSGYAPVTLGGRVSIQDLATLASARFTLVRVPWCRVCGER